MLTLKINGAALINFYYPELNPFYFLGMETLIKTEVPIKYYAKLNTIFLNQCRRLFQNLQNFYATD